MIYLDDFYKKYLNHHHSHIKRLSTFANEYENRILDVMLSPYNLFIPREKSAGKLDNDIISMHNGIKVYADSYYPELILPMLIANRGVHEPEEEAYFNLVLNEISNMGPLIIELGAYWGFYSLWFLKEFANGRAILIEPDISNMNQGKKNFKLNNKEAMWINGKIGNDGIKIDELFSSNNIGKCEILHCDIQGAELEMLYGAKNSIKNKQIDFMFISTHSNEIHNSCLHIIKEYGYHIVYDTDMNKSSCFDGLIVASANELHLSWTI